MSGIVGIFYLDGRPVDPVDLQKMVDILAHRGPDGADVWYQTSVGLGHRMLWTTPESLSEKLPLVGRSGDLVLTADARIDNRDELIEALGFGDRPAGEITDSDLILASYQKWGEECPARLIGDFAFVIWDEREQQLFCARDHMGVKPFYYYHGTDIFVFASEIKALLCLPGVPRRLNEVRVADHLVEIFEDTRITFYEDVLRLPAASSLFVSGDKFQITRYWMPDLANTIKLASNEAYAEAFREIFSEAIRCRLRSAFPIGSSLSGGLDSSSIVSIARTLLNADNKNFLKTFSLIFPNLPFNDRKRLDERKYINSVLNLGELEPHYIHADRLNPLAPLRQTNFNYDGPLIFPNQFLHQALFKSAHNQNVRVYLDGHNGDGTVSHGEEYLIELVRTGRWAQFYSQASILAKKYGAKRRKVLWSYGINPFITPIRQLFKGKCPDSKEKLTNALINPDFAHAIGAKARMQALCKNRQILTRTTSEIHWNGMYTGLSFLWREVTDQSAAIFAIEPRFPFCDKRLVEFCLNLPAVQKMYRGWDRVIMRRAMNNILPGEVQWRPHKANLSSNFDRNLLEYEQAALADIVVHKAKAISKYVDFSKLTDTYEQWLSDPVKSHEVSVRLFGVVTLAGWLKNSNVTGTA